MHTIPCVVLDCQVYDLGLVNQGEGMNWIENTGLWEVFTC